MGVINFKNYHISRSKKYMPFIADQYGNKWDNKDICDLLNSAENEVAHLEYLLETLIGYDRVDYLMYLLLQTKEQLLQDNIIVGNEKDIDSYQKAQIELLNYLINKLWRNKK